MQRFLHGAARRYDLWLLSSPVTAVRGPRYRRSRDEVAMDITYACDLRCYNCNRSCSQDPSDDHMSLGQIRWFLEESRRRQIRWKRIGLLGGEPTCHPQFLEVVDLVVRYRDQFSPDTQVRVVSNGHSDRAKRLLAQLPPGVLVKDTAKSSREQPSFYTFNVAPIDLPDYRAMDFSNACPVAQDCGLGVTPYGYYPCSVAGAIDRTFGFDLGRKALPADRDGMKQELRTFCALCGRFKMHVGGPHDGPLEGPVMSPTWAQAYERSRNDPPRLTRLPEWSDPDGSTGPARWTGADGATGPAERVDPAGA